MVERTSTGHVIKRTGGKKGIFKQDPKYAGRWKKRSSNTSPTTPTEQKIQILQSGVRYGNTTYTGQSVVPNSGGLTAAQIRSESLRAAKAINPNIKAGGYTQTYTQSQAQSLAATRTARIASESRAKSERAARLQAQKVARQAAAAKAAGKTPIPLLTPRGNRDLTKANPPSPITTALPEYKIAPGFTPEQIAEVKRKNKLIKLQNKESKAARERAEQERLERIQDAESIKARIERQKKGIFLEGEQRMISLDAPRPTGCAGRDYATCNVGERIDKKGTGSFTMAMDVGNNKMQDILLSYSGGKITKVGKANMDTAKNISSNFYTIQQKEMTEGGFLTGSAIKDVKVPDTKKENIWTSFFDKGDRAARREAAFDFAKDTATIYRKTRIDPKVNLVKNVLGFGRQVIEPYVDPAIDYSKQVGQNIVDEGMTLFNVGKRIIQAPAKDIIDKTTPEQRGSFYNYTGKVKKNVVDEGKVLLGVGKGIIQAPAKEIIKKTTPEQRGAFNTYIGEVGDNLKFAGGAGIEIARRVEQTTIPALTLDEGVYLPDGGDIDKYNLLVKESNLLKGKLRGGELGGFLREQQKDLTTDIGRYNQALAELDKAANDPKLKQYGQSIKEMGAKLSKLSKNENATQKDVDQFNRIKENYESEIIKYDNLYAEYEGKFERTENLEKRITRGNRGDGWKVVKDASDDFQKRTGKSATLARSLLKAGVSAYKVEKVVLITQVGGTLVAGTKIGGAVLTMLEKPLSILSSPTVIGISGVTIGGLAATQEYKKSGDIGYTLGAGLGTSAGFFGSVYSKPIVETGIKGGKGLITGIRKTPEIVTKGVKQFVRDLNKIKVNKRGEMYAETVQSQSDYIDVRDEQGNWITLRKSEAIHRGLYQSSRAEVRAATKDLSTDEKINLARQLYDKLPKGKTPEARFARKNFFKGMENAFGTKFIRAFKATLGGSAIVDVTTPSRSNQFGNSMDGVFGRPSAYAGEGSQFGQGSYEQSSFIGQSSLGTPTISPTTATPTVDSLSFKEGIIQKDLSLSAGLFMGVRPDSLSGFQDLDKKAKTDFATFTSLGLSDSLIGGQKEIVDIDTKQTSGTDQIIGQPEPRPELRPPELVVRPRRRPPKRPPKIPPIFRIGMPDVNLKGGKKKVYQGYHAEYVPEGAKKFKRINKEPQTLKSALSTMAREVDTFRTKVGRLVQGKKIVTKKVRGKSPIVDTKDNYYQRNKHKFQSFAVSQSGRKQMLPKNTFLEKKKYQRDKPQERKGRRKTPFGF